MARPLRIQFPGALYHLTNRGNERKAIFSDDEDRRQFVDIMRRSIDIYSVTVHSFVLMDNHWHLLAQTPLGNLSEFMRYFNIAYTSHFNRRHKRSGHLYQGRYKSILVDQDTYLAQVSRYIHLNPVKVYGLKSASRKKQRAYLFDYQWSSLPGYLDAAGQLDFVTYDMVLAPYGGNNKTGRSEYQRQISEDLNTGLAIKSNIVGQTVLGSDEYVSWVKETYLDTSRDRERPALRKIHTYLSSETILNSLEKEFSITLDDASGTDRHLVMAMLYKYAGMKNNEIGALFNCDYSTVSQARKRLGLKAERDRVLKKRIEAVEGILSRIKI